MLQRHLVSCAVTAQLHGFCIFYFAYMQKSGLLMMKRFKLKKQIFKRTVKYFYHMSHDSEENRSSGLMTRSDTNQALYSHRRLLHWGLNFGFRKKRECTIQVAKTKGGYREADLRLCFRICKKSGFLMPRLILWNTQPHVGLATLTGHIWSCL